MTPSEKYPEWLDPQEREIARLVALKPLRDIVKTLAVEVVNYEKFPSLMQYGKLDLNKNEALCAGIYDESLWYGLQNEPVTPLFCIGTETPHSQVIEGFVFTDKGDGLVVVIQKGKWVEISDLDPQLLSGLIRQFQFHYHLNDVLRKQKNA